VIRLLLAGRGADFRYVDGGKRRRAGCQGVLVRRWR
jgi:hypothetical protein